MILLIGRVWQSFTLGVLLVATRLLISEHSDSDKTIQKLMELFSVGILATAAVAPTVGAVLTVSYGWRSVHALILLLTVVTCMSATLYFAAASDNAITDTPGALLGDAVSAVRLT